MELESSLECPLSLHDSWTTQETLSSGLGVRLVEPGAPTAVGGLEGEREREGGRKLWQKYTANNSQLT